MWVRLWRTIDKWGPAATAGVCLAVVAVIGWWYSARISYERGVNDTQHRQIEILHNDIEDLRREREERLNELRSEFVTREKDLEQRMATLQAYVNSLEKKVIAKK